jgi:hypothetical protein
MLEKAHSRPDLLLLLSLVLVIVTYPVLDHGDVRRLIRTVTLGERIESFASITNTNSPR